MVRANRNLSWKHLMAAASLAGFGCGGSSQGTEPQDMSAAEHERAAGAEQAQAEQHSEQYDPAATSQTARCAKAVCWTSDTNPTAQHEGDMAKHRQLAADHRAAGKSLLDAEARACVGISEEDRDTSPFYHREDIASVSDVNKSEARGKAQIETAVGSRVVFRAVPGLTAEWLQRLVDCHMARAAAVGYEMPEMPFCPLAVKGANATVTSTGDGFAVEITSGDGKSVEEIRRRAKALSQS